MKKNCFCFGLGYSALTLADRLRADGWQVAGTCRDAGKAKALQNAGIDAYVWAAGDVFSDEMCHAIMEADYIVHSVAPVDGKDVVLHAWQQSALNWQGVWFAYLCTTGVYGDAGGAWVDEESALKPNAARQQWRVDAEAAWRATDLPVHVFRLAGIYGPERNSLLQLKAGTARRIVKERQYFSRIHVEDIAQVLMASMRKPNAGRVYNVCDDVPAPSHEVVEFAASLLGVQPPPALDVESAEISAMARSFYSCNRRVRNERMKGELGVSLFYPDYQSGLRQCLSLLNES